MKITVAICTWNRAALLDQTLGEFARLRIPTDTSWEVLVVNNNCTDATDEVLTRHASNLPLRRLFEGQPGLSNARNCALGASDGDLVLWTDDDVLVDSGWLAAYHEAARSSPEASFFGGTVDPLFAQTPPRWIRDNLDLLESAFALRKFG